MLGSAISKRWVVSLALVGLVSLFMASYSAVWSDPASAATTGGTVPGQILTDVQAISELGLTAGQVISVEIAPFDEDGNIDLDMEHIIYTWNSGACGTFANATTTGITNTFTAVSTGCSSGTITVRGNQRSGADVPSGGRTIAVNVAAPPAAAPVVPLTAADDGDLNFASDEAVNESIAEEIASGSGFFSEGAVGANVVPSQSSAVADDSGNTLAISAGSLDSGSSAVVVVETIQVADLAPPPPAQTSGSTSGTFRFGSSAIQISFFDGGDLSGTADKTRLNRPAQVCMTYTQADLDGAYGGPDGVKIWHYNGTAWVALSTTLFTNPNRVCAYTSSFSPFALGLAVAPPEAEASSAPTGLPATGDYTPGVNGLLLALFAGFALVGTGVFTARRARRVRENS